MVVRKRVRVSGRVQGVWFRQSCADLADRLGVSGWVRNLPDGRVEAVFEGDQDAVESMIGWCHDGPPRAVVATVDVITETPEGSNGFAVA